MPKPSDITLKQVAVDRQQIDYRTPIKFGGRVVNDVVVDQVTVDVESNDGRTAQGVGSMPVGNVWAWPTNEVTGDETLDAMLRFSDRYVEHADTFTESGDPLQLTHGLAEAQAGIAREVCEVLAIEMPKLAQLVAASPLEAAIHDAFGKLLGLNSYNALGSEFINHDLAHYLNDDFAGEYLDQYTSRQPKASLPLYHLVGALDPLTKDDIETPIDDGLPEALGDWILADGLTHLKIKLSGDDLDWDVRRVLEVDRVAIEAQSQRGCQQWFYSLDFNEKCANVDYVLEFLAKVEAGSPAALSRAHYIEQPTHRDLRSNPENLMHEAAKIKPVVIDESLVDFESLLLAQEQGYSGVALKGCKGHSEALLMGAAAQKYKMFLCVQDLTCVGASFLHSASLAARIPTIAAIEGNGRQYCPAGNQGWKERFPSMFHITDGTVGTHALDRNGLGF